MKIAVIGAGNVGATLGRRFAECGHDVVIGVRRPDDPDYAALRAVQGVSVTSAAAAVEACEVVLLAIPWAAVIPTVRELGELLDGKIIVDATNPIRADFGGLERGEFPSAAEALAALVPASRVVKAFNTTGAENMANPGFPEGRAVMLVCGDDADSTRRVAELATEIGFEGIAAGPLRLAEQLEQFAWLWIHLAFKTGLGRTFAFQLMRR